MKKYRTISVILFFFMLVVVLTGIYMFMHMSTNQLLVINNSGSTNFPGYSITVNSDGSGTLKYAANGINPKKQNQKNFTKGTFAVNKLRLLISNIGDVNNIPTGHMCIKSVSFGSSTTVTYNHHTSGDISCTDLNSAPVYKQFSDAISQIQDVALK